ncbi:hypothetical protein C8F04DRAFT_1156511 [Mycena alexandri]|uniref:MYND-type domain-containing protein n=1 Tax=Mycena alexandri TaxID=1745969 RepID=A0AAD6RZY5_9AGAR|nr:hypothetical protein C8F04DRAFT_1156511 [Mycena alexandri]
MAGYVPKVDTERLMASSEAGIAAIRAGLDEKRAFVKEAKLFCDRCKKQETSASPLQACSRCRSVRYCSRDCQVAHYKTAHKKACANFEDPPLCRAFNHKVPLPGCSYPEMPIFAQGVSEGMGAWVSAGGSIDCRLAALPGGIKSHTGNNQPRSVEHLMAMTPGMVDGKYLSLTILVQNRSPKAKPMVVVGLGIVAVATPRGTPIILEGKDPGEPSRLLDYPHLNGRVLALAKASAELTHFNGKSIKDGETCPALKDPKMCAVLLNVGEYAMFTVEFRAGGPNITHDFQAFELLEHVIVPAIAYDPNTPQNKSYAELLPAAADRDEVCEVRAKIDQRAVEAWYRDYKTKGEVAYVTSHYGEARAKMVGSGNQALAEMLKAMMGMKGLSI